MAEVFISVIFLLFFFFLYVHSNWMTFLQLMSGEKKSTYIIATIQYLSYEECSVYTYICVINLIKGSKSRQTLTLYK